MQVSNVVEDLLADVHHIEIRTRDEVFATEFRSTTYRIFGVPHDYFLLRRKRKKLVSMGYEAIPDLLNVLSGKSSRLNKNSVRRAHEALHEIGNETAIETLIPGLEERLNELGSNSLETTQAKSIITLLGDYQVKSAIPILKKVLENTPYETLTQTSPHYQAVLSLLKMQDPEAQQAVQEYEEKISSQKSNGSNPDPRIGEALTLIKRAKAYFEDFDAQRTRQRFIYSFSVHPKNRDGARKSLGRSLWNRFSFIHPVISTGVILGTFAAIGYLAHRYSK
ncbi:MAG: hypothetical protein QF915_03865 [Candidatus Woesearchaeota archaeon]|jgi:hypothetical protein|nr:hypothetical protein [Candidatus Woesearchaeota archaeon]MDP7457782.1 hypothetical protein [Candidatus Woesearchaeota archaeon]